MHGLTSIVIVTHDQLEYTRLCVERIRRHTPEPYELVFVDNGSTDGTAEWFKSLGLRVESGEPEGDGRRKTEDETRDDGGFPSLDTRHPSLAPLRVTVIANAENRGFPAAANQGIRAASGKQILLLNNDTVVTSGWLTRMLRALYSSPDPSPPARRDSEAQPSPRTRGEGVVGMVGPVSNFVSGPQQVPVTYESGGPEGDGRRKSKDERRDDGRCSALGTRHSSHDTRPD